MSDTPPPWLDTATLHHMERAREQALAWGRDPLAAADAAREVLLARRPSLPMTMIEDAVGAVVSTPVAASAKGMPATAGVTRPHCNA